MSFLALLLAAIMGGVAGVASGLLGIGGGILMVPLLYLLMGGPAWSGLVVAPEHEAALAHATSLFVIIFAALSGLRAFHRQGAVNWGVVLPLAGAAALAALLASQLAAGLPSPLLKALFGGFLLVSGIRLHRTSGRRAREGGGPGAEEEVPLRWWGALLGGALVGFLSALLGVGGGIVAIPVLVHFARMGAHRVVPASIAIICFAAPAGVLGYMFAGQGVAGLPAGSLGFVHFPTALAMLPGAVLMAPVGARLNRRLRGRTLELAFVLLMVGMGAWLLWSNGSALVGAP